MPNDWDQSVLISDRAAQSNNEIWNQAVGGADASSLATPEQIASRRGRRVSWGKRGIGEKLIAAGRSTINNLPIVGEALSPSGQPDVQEFRENMPVSAFGTNVVGSGIPLMAGAPRVAAPAMNSLFGTVPRATATGATVGGLDAATRDQNPVLGAATGGLTSAGIAGLTKGITPRSDATRYRINRDAAREQFEATRRELVAATKRRKKPATSVDELAPSARGRIATAGETPVPQIPPFGELPWYLQSALGGGASALATGGHPLLSLAGAAATPLVARGIKSGRNRINQMLSSARGRRYMNNRVLNDRMRNILNSAGIALEPDISGLSNEDITNYLGQQ